MLSHVQDLHRHQAWADAEHWRCVLVHGPAREDAAIKERLTHIHGAQQIWMARWQDLPWTFPKADDFPTLEDLLHFAKSCHVTLLQYVAQIKETDLSRVIKGKRVNGDPFESSFLDTLIHVAHHSDYHRGQNATRMRELGSKMSPTGWIDWTRLNKAEASWA
jgi:uncharacterized damage-inducible protein DinB